VRVNTNVRLVGHLAFALGVVLGGCDKFKRTDPAQASRARAEVKRQQAACGSASAADRLKNAIFDRAIAERTRDRANLDVLADYSVARLQDPVVSGQDRSLDITRCKGRFILDLPPGAEPGFAGQHELQAQLDYTAQASADGNGLVYQQKGAEQIVAKLAAFRLGTQAYRPPPAIDELDASTAVAADAAPAATEAPGESPRPAIQAPVPVDRRTHLRTPRSATSGGAAQEGTSIPAQQTSTSSPTSEATVRAFYSALHSGNGAAAASQVVPEKRSGGPYSPAAMSRFYGHLREPIRLTGIVPLRGGAYRVQYHYSAGRSECNGSAVVRLTKREGRDLIGSIHAQNGC
jgi:hypothetical protein